MPFHAPSLAEPDSRKSAFRMILQVLLAAALVCVALCLYLTNAGILPYGCHIDEAGMGYDALCLARYGVDRYRIRYPVYFINYGGGQNALYTYCAALLIRLTGRWDMALLRLPSALFGIAAMGAISIIVGRRFGRRWGWTAAVLYLILPWFIMRSRFGLESLLMMPTLAIGLCLLVLALELQKTGLFFLSGLAFGVSLYSYALDYIVLPIFLLLVLAAMLRAGKLRLRQVIALGIPLAVLAAPLILFLFINHFGLPQIETALFTIPRMSHYRGSELHLLSPAQFLTLIRAIFWCDIYEYNSLPAWGVMYSVSVPLIVLGMGLVLRRAALAWKEKRLSIDLLVSCLFAGILVMAILLGGDGGGTINCNHINGIYLCTFYMLVSALHFLCRKVPCLLSRIPALAGSAFARWACPVLLTAVYGFYFASFAGFYFGRYPAIAREYPPTMMQEFPTELCAEMGDLLMASDRVYVDVAYPLFLLATNASPYEYTLEPKNSGNGCSLNPEYDQFRYLLKVDTPDPDAVYLIWQNDSYNWGPLQESELFDYERFGDFVLFAPYNTLSEWMETD